jgi:predicted phosphodiesterase
MRLAVISDIHGNVAAREAALDDIARRGITNIICLGDCASGMCWPNETTRLLMDKNIPTLRGNHDRWLTDRVAEGLKGQDGFALQETMESSERDLIQGAKPMVMPVFLSL